MPSITVSGSIDPLLSVVLNKGESIFAERNAMVSMDATLALTGRAKGGFFSALSRKVLNDESFFQQKIEAVDGPGEVLLTPLQIANLGATIANRGYYYTPHVVKKVQGERLEAKFREKHITKASRRAYEYIVAGMRRAVTGGTCRAANRPEYEACGKTGTAQNHGHDHSIFMGFAPMDNPKIAVAVYVENGGWGADYGVPIGSLMMEQYINGKLSPESEKKAEAFQHRRISYGTESR